MHQGLHSSHGVKLSGTLPWPRLTHSVLPVTLRPPPTSAPCPPHTHLSRLPHVLPPSLRARCSCYLNSQHLPRPPQSLPHVAGKASQPQGTPETQTLTQLPGGSGPGRSQSGLWRLWAPAVISRASLPPRASCLLSPCVSPYVCHQYSDSCHRPETGTVPPHFWSQMAFSLKDGPPQTLLLSHWPGCLSPLTVTSCEHLPTWLPCLGIGAEIRMSQVQKPVRGNLGPSMHHL